MNKNELINAVADKSGLTKKETEKVLKAFTETVTEELKKGGSVGRKLDFIAQEMNREANTIASKANDFELAKIVVDVKAEIEKIREQVQNIE